MIAAMTTESPMHGLRAGAVRLRRAVLWLIFGSILMIPKINRLRRHSRAWNFGRSFAGLAGLAMIAIGAAERHKFAIIALGALALLLALLLAPERPKLSVDARARELGALVVVDGGVYNSGADAPHRAKLFIGADRLWVLNSALAVLFEIPLQQLRAADRGTVGRGLEAAPRLWPVRGGISLSGRFCRTFGARGGRNSPKPATS